MKCKNPMKIDATKGQDAREIFNFVEGTNDGLIAGGKSVRVSQKTMHGGNVCIPSMFESLQQYLTKRMISHRRQWKIDKFAEHGIQSSQRAINVKDKNGKLKE